jgi:sterol desaturase/sphingolipid hydroxylase (fatty acid hydroxylase superfamily)
MGFEFLEKDYTLWFNFLYLFIVFSVIVFLRYLILSEAYFRGIYSRFRSKNSNRILSEVSNISQKKKEIYWSGISSLLFGLIAVFMIMAWQMGWTMIYTDWVEYPIWYPLVSLILASFAHETYYYWLHRALHQPSLFKLIHKVHHDSVSTSVWTSFSFHPLESLLQAIIIPIIVMIIPMHIYVLIVFLIFMTISAMINHAGIEIFPTNSHRHWLGKYFIGATHHDQHHRRYLCNYGLYYTLWDRWMSTESPDYDAQFEKHTIKQNGAKS